MHKIFVGLAFLLGAGSGIGSQETDVMAPVRQFILGFNNGDLKMAEAACAEHVFIIDDFPPHAWAGSGAIEKWLHDLGAFEKKHGTSNPFVVLGKPRQADVTGNQAYLVVPTKLSYKKKGEQINENGLMTLVLHKRADGWRIIAWSWTDN
jgi:ketosteroid isomerase-like protein